MPDIAGNDADDAGVNSAGNDTGATDRARLLKEAYATPDNFVARQSIYRFRDPPQDLIGWVIDHLPTECLDTVLDAGAGNGTYERRLRDRATSVVAFDLSFGMISSVPAHPSVHRGVADVVNLPLRSASCTGAFANHMLYHVPDVAAAARELRRVLKPSGVLVAATNGERHWDGLVELLQSALNREGQATEWPVRPFHRFAGPSGADILATAFKDVHWQDIHGDLVIPIAQPVVDYVASMKSWLASVVTVPWDDYLRSLTAVCDEIVARRGAITIHTHAGAFTCR